MVDFLFYPNKQFEAYFKESFETLSLLRVLNSKIIIYYNIYYIIVKTKKEDS